MKAKTLLLMPLALLLGVGCAKQKSTPTTPDVPYVQIPNGPYVPPTTGPGGNPGPTYTYGGTATLNILGNDLSSRNQLMQTYTGHPMNNPQNIVVNMNFSAAGTSSYGNVYGGTVTIGYQDTYNGTYQNIQGYFTSGTSTDANQYNIWMNYYSNRVFHAFLEDFMGGLMIVITSVTYGGSGDAPSPKFGNGNVWFKNFTPTPPYAPHPPTYCWFVQMGPYSCQAWNYGNGVNTYQADNPDSSSGWMQLGTFQNLDLSKAFNGNTNL